MFQSQSISPMAGFQKPVRDARKSITGVIRRWNSIDSGEYVRPQS